MAEMTSESDRERCRWFHNVIEEYALAAVSYTISTKELRRYVRRMFDDPNVQHDLENPWHHAMASLAWNYAENRPQIDLPLEPIDFIFDEASEKKLLLEGWEGFKKFNPKQAPLMGATPIFRDDKDYLPLQAADLFAWWIRHWQIDGIKGNEIYQCKFPWPRTKYMPWTHIVTEKSAICARLREMREMRGGFHRITYSLPPFSWPGRSS